MVTRLIDFDYVEINVEFFLARDIRYEMWKMAINRSLDWIERDDTDDSQCMLCFKFMGEVDVDFSVFRSKTKTYWIYTSQFFLVIQFDVIDNIQNSSRQ